jgi:exonuclease III
MISFNAKGLTLGREEIKKYLEQQNADVILLQEAEPPNDRIIEVKGMKSYKISPIIVMYTKYKVESSKALIDNSKIWMNAYSDFYDISIKGKTYRFINLYLQPFQFEKSMIRMNGNSDQNEQKAKGIVKRLLPIFKGHQTQVELIRKGVDNSPYPVILAGDFNAVPNSYEYYHLGKDLQDAFVKVGNGSSTSFHDYKFPIRIDFVFASKEIIPVSYHVDRSVHLSDHYPVISTFKLP